MRQVDWLRDARLLLRGRLPASPAMLLATGGLADMISEAMVRTSVDVRRLVIQLQDGDKRYSWAEICELASLSDFPVLI